MASQVPYTGVPDVAPQIDAMSNVHVDTPIAAFGGTVANAITQFGQTAEGVGKELFARADAFQTLDEQNKADERSADASDQFVQKYLELSEKKGREVKDALPGYMSDLDKIRQAGADGLSPYAKQKYLSDTRRFQTNMVWHGGQLARSAFDEADKQTSNLLIDKFGDQLARTNPNDTKVMSDTTARIKAEAEQLGQRQYGFQHGSPESQEFVNKNLSQQYSKAVIAARGSDPVRAKSMLEAGAKNGLLRPDDADRLKDTVDNAVDNKLGRQIGIQIAAGSGHADQDVKQVIQAARDAAEKADPGNKNLADNAADAAEARHNHEKQLDSAAKREQTGVLLRGIDGTDSNGKVPLLLDEAKQDPNWRKIYDSASTDVQGSIREKIRENQTTDGWIPNDEGNKQFNTLWTTMTDPRSSAKDVDAALNADPLQTKMTRQQRTEIQKLQDGILKNQSTQESVNSAMAIPQVRQALDQAGLTKGTSEYNEFAVQFGTAIKNYAEGGHRTVKDNEQIGAIAQQMLYHQTSSFLYRHTIGDTNLYQNILEAKPELKAQAIGAYKRLYNKTPTDEQIQQMAPMFYQKYFQELGQKSRPPVGKVTNKAS